MPKLDPEEENYTHRVTMFRTTQEDYEFLEGYAKEKGVKHGVILRLALSNLRKAVTKAKTKKGKPAQDE